MAGRLRSEGAEDRRVEISAACPGRRGLGRRAGGRRWRGLGLGWDVGEPHAPASTSRAALAKLSLAGGEHP
jgi:hypothetical protein